MADVVHARIRAFVLEEDERVAKMADLPFWWDRIDPNERDPDLPSYTRRHMMLSSYTNWSFTQRWAWDGLQRLLAALLERREPTPQALQQWAYSVALGTRPRPRKAKNAERNARMTHVARSLAWELGLPKEEAIGEIAKALSLPEGTVRSAVDAVRDARPFEKST